MCGVFGLFQISADEFQSRYNVTNLPSNLEDFYSLKITPRSTVATISRQSPNQLVPRIWWLAPPWSKDPYHVKFATFNARAEGIEKKPAFRHAWKKTQRCCIPASFFIEWETIDNPDNPKKPIKQPYRVQLKTGDTFSFAGLYEDVKDAEGQPIRTCTLITTQSTKPLSRIHSRQPVILDQPQESIWLDPATSSKKAKSLLKPTNKLELFPINPRFNKAKRNEVTKKLISEGYERQ